nr:hypothetical protein [Opitutaceae bacterium]
LARVEMERRVRALVEWLREPWDFSRVAGMALSIGVASGLVAWWRAAGRTWWLAWRSRRAASHRHDPVRREAARWLARLARHEVAADRTGPQAAQARSELEAAREQLLRLRFGSRESWAAPATVFRLARRARREARRAR